jgi:drug/metabolite transporter (DMT)-like permease
MTVFITLVAAMLLGTGFVLQQYAAQQEPPALFLRVALIADLFRRRRWLAGLAVMIAGQLASAYSVSHIDLSLAEPILATSLLFALALAVPLSGQRLRASELAGAVILAAGVAALSVARSTRSPAASFSSPSGWLAAAAIAAVAAAFVHAGLRRSGQIRATLTGAAAGLVFGISDALTRRTVHLMDVHSFASLLTTWPAYSLIGASLVGLWLMQSAFSAAPLHASLPAISAAEPVAGILLGVIVFGDSIRISAAMIALQAIGLVALVGGVILVARAPVLSQLRPRYGLARISERMSGRRPDSADPTAAHPASPDQTSRQRASQQENAPNITSPIATKTSSQGPSGV